MILAIERKDNVCWMDPVSEASYEQAIAPIGESGRGAGSYHYRCVHVLRGNGAVNFYPDYNSASKRMRGLLDGTQPFTPASYLVGYYSQ